MCYRRAEIGYFNFDSEAANKSVSLHNGFSDYKVRSVTGLIENLDTFYNRLLAILYFCSLWFMWVSYEFG